MAVVFVFQVRSRNVRGSVRTLCPHLTIQIDKRAVVLLLLWLQCLQACRQVVRPRPTRDVLKSTTTACLVMNVKPRALWAHRKKPCLNMSLLHDFKVTNWGEKWLWQLVVLLDNCLFWQDHELTVFYEIVIFGCQEKSFMCRGHVVTFLWSQAGKITQKQTVDLAFKGQLLFIL